jgi:methylated-DNA-[protein]-cysteine S-methyltransferase
MNNTTRYTYVSSPLGKLLLTTNGAALTRLCFPCHQDDHTLGAGWRRDDEWFEDVRRQLREYFAGELDTFDVKLDMAGTPFERRVWGELCKIPYGTTASYGQIAKRIGQATACRAVGLANGRNPIPIIVPCHRVIGSDGSLTGYGGGLDTKRWLLALERVELQPARQKKSLATAR